MEELKKAIKNISNKKQPEHGKIFPEFIKNLGPKATDRQAITSSEQVKYAFQQIGHKL